MASPARAVYDHIWAYLQGNAVYVDIDFGFLKATDMKSFATRLERLISEFDSPHLRRYGYFT